MIKLFYKLKQTKSGFVFLISFLTVFAVDVCLLLFDIIQLIIASKSGVNLGQAFLPLNIIASILKSVVIICFIDIFYCFVDFISKTHKF